MRKYLILFMVSLCIFGWVRDYNKQVKKEKERVEETNINYNWCKQLKEGRFYK